ncbi:MAG: PPC domain-containing DNA-binding protein [Pseudomonadota bacterium]
MNLFYIPASPGQDIAMNELSCFEFQRGRLFVGRLPHGKDLILSVEEFCEDASIQMATFSVIGAVSSATIGAYDQKQQVYVTFKEEAPLEIVSCIGNISLKDGKPFIHAHILLADEQGKTIGGHLFSETIIFAGEINLQELTGKPMERTYDNDTGLMLWK